MGVAIIIPGVVFTENSAKTFRIAKNEQFTRVSPQ